MVYSYYLYYMNARKIRNIIGVGFFLVVTVGAVFIILNKGTIYISLKKGVVASEENVVLYQDTGFSPNVFTIKKGIAITFMNSSSNALWVGSDLHPMHDKYPGSHIDKCATIEELKIFDSCRNIKSGSTWSFIFNEIGMWGYHNHLRSDHVGAINVVE